VLLVVRRRGRKAIQMDDHSVLDQLLLASIILMVTITPLVTMSVIARYIVRSITVGVRRLRR